HQVLGRDPGGRVTSRADTNNGGSTTTRVFDYDTAGRLQNVTLNGVLTKTYRYDANGKRKSGDPVGNPPLLGFYDTQDRLTSYNGVPYTFTNNGELSTRNGVAFSYDVRGNLRSAGAAVYSIDGDGRRIAVKNGSAWKGFLYGAGPRPVAEL